MAYDPNNIFANIIRGEIPCAKVYEDEHVLAFNDISPQTPTHILVVPKQDLPSLKEATADDQQLLGHLLCLCSKRSLPYRTGSSS